MKKRTRARELALQFLYMLDLCGAELLDEARDFLRQEESDKTSREFALHLIRGTAEHRAEIDELIREVAQNWEIKRMAAIDRNVLRMATFELLHCPDIPLKVSINEAIELGKRFSTQNSGGFINGVLDKIKDKAVARGVTKIEAPSGGDEEEVGSREG
jgi:transcription antitermination factor NusB